MNNEKSSTLSDWPAGSNAFGLYLVLGVILALFVIGAFGFFHRSRTDIKMEPPQRAITTKEHSRAVGAGAAGSHVSGENTQPAAQAEKL